MKVIYLTWGETPRTTGVYGSQVIAQLCSIREHLPESKIALVTGLPLIFSGLYRENLGYIGELKKIRQQLGKILHKIIYIYGSQSFYYSRRYEFSFLHNLSHMYLYKFICEFSPNIVHCRSYHSAYAALKVRESYRLSYKVVFDPRGLWVEEGVLKGRFKDHSLDYFHNKKIEQYILDKSDITISVSDTMHRHYREMGAKNGTVIYLSASVKSLKNISDNIKEKKTLCYVGSLSNKTWHKPRFLFDLYRKYRESIENPSLLIITQSNHHEIMELRGEIPLSEIQIVTTNSSAELAPYLHQSTFGALPYFIPSSRCEITVAKTVLASKTAEYLAAGLPIILNKYCGGARALISNKHIGLAYTPENLDEVNQKNLSKLAGKKHSTPYTMFAEQWFCIDNNSTKYCQVYKDLLEMR
jgi:glycosyltransferase involved in cell wall biosynthesis